MRRLRNSSVALTLIASGATILHLHHHKAPTPTVSAQSSSVVPLRASRSQERVSLPGRRRAPKSRPVPRQRPHLTRVDLGYLDTTAYCATGNLTASGVWPEVGQVAVLNRSIHFGTRLLIDGNVYTVTDWIGHGSDVDLFFGDGADCERRALDYGRRRLHVVEAGR